MTTAMFGPYRLDGLLGRGGMGEVHRAVDTSQGDRPVALKLLAPHLSTDEAFRARFRRECETAARLDEPHVVPIHRYGEIDGRLFLDMQLVGGCDLAAELTRTGPLPPERAVGIVAQVAAALDAAHRAGLVHRDVKPSNILLAAPAPGRPDFAQLADFGIASGPGGTGESDGTAEYLAPERLLGAPADHRVDVYALACVLYELLTGLRVFPGADFAAQVHGHLYLPPPRPSDAAAWLPPGLDRVVARGMAKDPGHRHPTAGTLADDARAALAGGATVPVTAANAPGAAPRTSRRRLLVGVVGAAVLAGGGAVAVALTRAPRPGPTGPRPEPVIVERALAVRSTSPFPFRTTKVGDAPAIIVDSLEFGTGLYDIVEGRRIGADQSDVIVNVDSAEVVDVDGRAVLVAGTGPTEIVAVDVGTGRSTVVGVHASTASGLVAATIGDRVIAAVIADEQLCRWDVRTGAEIGRRPAPGAAAFPPLTAWDAGGRTFATVPGPSGAYVWDLATGEEVARPRHPGAITEFGGVPVVVSTIDGLTVTDLHTGAVVRRHDLGRVVTSAVAVVDGRSVLAVPGGQNTVVLRDLDSGAPLGAPLSGHQADLTALGVTDLRGRPVLVSAARDNTIRVWDLAVRAAG